MAPSFLLCLLISVIVSFQEAEALTGGETEEILFSRFGAEFGIDFSDAKYKKDFTRKLYDRFSHLSMAELQVELNKVVSKREDFEMVEVDRMLSYDQVCIQVIGDFGRELSKLFIYFCFIDDRLNHTDFGLGTTIRSCDFPRDVINMTRD